MKRNFRLFNPLQKKTQKRLREIHQIVMFNAYFAGRIAQLVERLSYTQVVIGSSPVAPITCKICGSSSIG